MDNAPTLTALPMAPVATPAPPSIEDLGVRGALYLAALLTAQEHRVPVAPTLRATLAILELLREHGLIEVPWPDQRWNVAPDAEETPIEHLHWRYAWSACMRPGLREALEDFLQAVPMDDYGIAIRARLWEELTLAESESYFEQQLIKYHFDPAWARDLIFSRKQMQPALSIAQWRYCCWAAVRQGAAVAQQQRLPDSSAVREAIYAELRRRAGFLASGKWPNAFTPAQWVPGSAIGRLFTRQLVRFDAAYWNTPASAQALMFRPAHEDGQDS